MTQLESSGRSPSYHHPSPHPHLPSSLPLLSSQAWSSFQQSQQEYADLPANGDTSPCLTLPLRVLPVGPLRLRSIDEETEAQKGETGLA